MLAEQFAALTTGVLTHKVRLGVSSYGAPLYSTAESTYPCYYEARQRLVVGPEGKEVTSRGRIYVVSTSASMDTADFMSMDASTEVLRPIAVNVYRDLDGQHHLEIDI